MRMQKGRGGRDLEETLPVRMNIWRSLYEVVGAMKDWISLCKDRYVLSDSL